MRIVIIHEGDSYYLADTIAQARVAQGGEPPILLGDPLNRHYKGADFYPYSDYFKEARAFAGIYKHYYPNPAQYQWLLFCYQKWIFLREFMERESIHEVMVIDSDVLIYRNPSELSRFNVNAEMTISEWRISSMGASGHASLITSREILADLSELMWQMFLPGEFHERVRTFGEAGLMQTPPDGITEMTALSLLRERFPERVATNYFPYNGSAVCHSLLASQGFEMDGQMKLLRWIDGVPHGKWMGGHGIDAGVWIPFDALHFQGHAKRGIARAVSMSRFDVSTQRFSNKLRYQLRKTERRLLKLVGA